MGKRRTKRLRVLVLLHPDHIPPGSLEGTTERERQPWITYYDVVQALRSLGHEARLLGVQWELGPIRSEFEEFRPHVVFNLLEEFLGQVEFDHHVVAYLELIGAAYTGCNPRGLVLARGKALSKKIVSYHRIPHPAFRTIPRGRKARPPPGVPFPLIVKSLTADASTGISQASIVEDAEALENRVRFVHERVGTDAIVERFIPGREIYVAVLGHRRLRVFPPWEITFENLPEGNAAIATERAKHDPEYQRKVGLVQHPAEGLDAATVSRIERTSRRIYRILDLDGYARIDYRLAEDGTLFFLEANPNPDIGRNEEFACSAAEAGVEYEALIDRILRLALSRRR